MTNQPVRDPRCTGARPLGDTLRVMAFALVTLLWLKPPAAAQGAHDFTGTYRLQTDSGPITLKLEQSGTLVTGDLELGGFTYPLEGRTDDLGMFGSVFTGEAELYFEAELLGGTLFMIMAQVDPATGAPDPATAGEYLFERVGGSIQTAPPPLGEGPATPTSPAAPQAPTQPPGAPAAGEGQPADMLLAQVGRRYESGSRVGSPDAGVSFVVPSGYYAGYHPDLKLFVILSDTAPGLVAVSALSSMDTEQAMAELSRAFQSSEATVLPQGQPSLAEGVVRASFLITSANGSMPLYLVGAEGQAGNVLILAGVGAPQEQAEVTELVESIVRSAVLTRPSRASAMNAQGQLAGAQLRRDSSRSEAGLNDGYIDNAAIELDLCPTGQYAYLSSSHVAISVYGQDGGGVSGTSSSSEEDQGWWSLESGLLGPVLVLRSARGGADTYLELLQADGVLYVDGLPARVNTSQRCY